MTVRTNRMSVQANGLRPGQIAPPFDQLFSQHWPRVCAVLFRLVGDRDEAEDLAIEVFWRLYRDPPSSTSDDHLAGWLYRVATNLGLNALRGRRRRVHYEERGALLHPNADAGPNPATEAERSIERAAVRQVLARMKPRSAQLLTLRHSGLSYAELARALDVAPSSVGTLLARAEQEFEALYREQEGA